MKRNSLNKKQLLIDCFKNFSENVFLVEKNGTNISYGEFYTRSLRLLSLLNKKFRKGSRIIVKSVNSKDYLIFYIACLLGGYTACPVDPNITKKKLRYIKKTFKIENQINNFNNFNYENQKISNDIEFSSKVDFLIVFTSGTTTGESKGILHNSDSILGCAEAYSKIAGYDIETRVYHCLPMYYMAGISNTFFACIFSGSSIIIGDQVSATNLNNFWIVPQKLMANSLHLVPSLYYMLCELFNNDPIIKKHIILYRSIISTSSYLYPEIRKKFFEVFKKRIQSCYGVTELGGPLTIENIDDLLFEEETNSIGKPIKNIKIKIDNKNILIKSPFLMKGYLTFNNKVKKPRLLNNYYKTGDVGYFEDKILFFLGRSREIIKKGGEIVSLTLLENTALKMDFIKETSAVGIKNILTGEDILLFVVFKNNNLISKKISELNIFLKSELKSIEVPKKIIPIPEMIKTKSGKIIKDQLIKTYII